MVFKSDSISESTLHSHTMVCGEDFNIFVTYKIQLDSIDSVNQRETVEPLWECSVPKKQLETQWFLLPVISPVDLQFEPVWH